MSELKTERVITWVDAGKPHQTAIVNGVRFTITDLCDDNFEVKKIGINGDVSVLDGFISLAHAKSFVSKHLDNIESGSIFYQMSKNQRSNRQFMEGWGQVTRDTPGDPGPEARLSQFKIMLEEFLEYGAATGVRLSVDGIDVVSVDDFNISVSDTHFNLVEAADGLADIGYTRNGAANMLGIAMEPIDAEVCENNLFKLKTGTKNAEGKVIKHPDHPKPGIGGLLVKQGWGG
jgi:predicted HAD superfamily Cof-like phosphohydrolase